MRFVKHRCDDCQYLIKAGETWVPYGDTMVRYTDDYECSLGYDANAGDCPEETFQPVDHYSLMPGYQRVRDAGVD